MNKNDIKKSLIDGAKKPDTKANKQATESNESARRIIENALTDAEKGKLDGINDIFFGSLKKIRELSDADYIQFRNRLSKLDGYSNQEINKICKVYKKANTGSSEDSGEKQGRTSKADMLIELVRGKGTFFHNADDEVFVSFQVPHIDTETGEETGQHFETWNIRSRGFKNWASHLFYTTHETTPSDSGISEAIDTLSGLGQFEGEEIEVNLRYAFHDEKIYIDLGCKHWKIIEVSTGGYKVIESQNAPVKFIRSNIFRPLPVPEDGGNITLLWDHLNIESQDGRFLILAYILEAMRVTRPYPVLEIGGEQGSAKSTFQKRLREIIDPNKVNLRSAPRSVEDIFVATRNNHIISYNNLSHLTANTQDAFCTLSTGGGDATRKLYSTSEEEAWEAMRPIMMNGISMLATRPDLADRTVALELPRVKGYITEAQLQEDWEKDLPLILGAIYSLLAKTLVELPAVVIDKPPRMADFARLGQAMLNALDVDESFTDLYMRNRDRVVLRAIEASPVAQSIITLIEKDIYYKGTRGGLMDRLTHHQPKYFDRSSYPKSVRGLMDALRRLAPALRVRDIEVIEDKKRHKDGYHVEIRKITPTSPKPAKKEIEL